MELYLPPPYAKLHKGTEFYKTSDTFKKFSEASKKKMKAYWSDKRHRRRVDKKQAKPLDVFDLEGRYIASYPSSRKAAEGLGFENKKSAERNIRKCRQGGKKSYMGYMFRDHTNKPDNIEPMKQRVYKRGYHVNRRPDTYEYAKKPVRMTFDDGDTIDFPSMQECADAIHGTRSGIWLAMKQNRKYKRKYLIEYIP